MPAKHFVSAVALVLFVAYHAASAVSLSPRGVGQALIYPYYTVNKSQDTLISVVNASDISKAVQVRLREGYNGRDVLSFVLYLSPHDVWTASISQLADDGGAALKTSDASCTDPAIPAAGVALRSADYDGTGTQPADGGPTSITRTREGFIELIAGADITPGSPTDIAITHVQTGQPGAGTPPGCATLNDAMTLADEVTPTSGIFGSGTIVNVGEGTFFAYNADALDGFTAVPLFSPASDIGPSLIDANSTEAVSGVATAYVTDANGIPLALDYQFGIDAVSAVFMADALYNEYIVAATLGANTDWVVTFPTKSFYVDPFNGPIAPFTDTFHAPGLANVDLGGDVYDREESVVSFGQPCVICPPPLPLPGVSYQVNVLPLRNEVVPTTTSSGVFGSNLVSLAIPPNGDDGNVVLNLATPNGIAHTLPGGLDVNGVAVTLAGLPVDGFMAYNVINANAQPGLLANYSGAFPHRATTQCQANIAGCVPVNTGSTP